MINEEISCFSVTLVLLFLAYHLLYWLHFSVIDPTANCNLSHCLRNQYSGLSAECCIITISVSIIVIILQMILAVTINIELFCDPYRDLLDITLYTCNKLQ